MTMTTKNTTMESNNHNHYHNHHSSSSLLLWYSSSIPCHLIHIVHNYQLKRLYEPSYTNRTEGYTERWGGVSSISNIVKDNDDPTKATKSTTTTNQQQQQQKEEEEEIDLTSTTDDSSTTTKTPPPIPPPCCPWYIEEIPLLLQTITTTTTPSPHKQESTKDDIDSLFLLPPAVFEERMNTITITNNSNKIQNQNNRMVRFYQYEPGWFEQLILHCYEIPYVVCNSSYHVTEVCGPLPYLLDMNTTTTRSSHTTTTTTTTTTSNNNNTVDYPPPAMIGRYYQKQQQQQQQHPVSNVQNPSNVPYQYPILEYIQDSFVNRIGKNTGFVGAADRNQNQNGTSSGNNNKDDDPKLKNQYYYHIRINDFIDTNENIEIKNQAYLLHQLIEETLYPALECINYYNYHHHEKCDTSFPITTATTTTTSFFTKYQLWIKRLHSIQRQHVKMQQHQHSFSSCSSNNSVRSNSSTTTPRTYGQAMEQLQSGYHILEQQLVKQYTQQQHEQEPNHHQPMDGRSVPIPRYLFGTTLPVLVDLVLFDHLMKALNDIDVMILLVDYPNLVTYVQTIYQTYFEPITTTGSSSSSTQQQQSQHPDPYRSWNCYQNTKNIFFKNHPLNSFATIIRKKKISTTTTTTKDCSSSSSNNDSHMVSTTMESLLFMVPSTSRRTLHDTLVEFKELRNNLSVSSLSSEYEHGPLLLPPSLLSSYSTWYRWRMGDTLFKSAVQKQNEQLSNTNHTAAYYYTQQQQQQQQNEDYNHHDTSGGTGSGGTGSTSHSSDNPIQVAYQKQINEHRKNDEIWITSAVTVMCAIVLGFGIAGIQLD